MMPLDDSPTVATTAPPAPAPRVSAPARAGTPRGDWLLALFVGGPALVVLLGASASWLWVGELAVHWSTHATLVLLALLPACWRRPRAALALLLLVLVGAMPALRSWKEPRLVPPAAAAGATAISAAFANVYDFNRQRPLALETLAALDAQVVGLTEVSESDRHAFADARWPFQHWQDRDEVLSVALLSAYPIASATLHDLDGAGVLVATLIPQPGRELRVIVAHLFSPKNGEARRRRNGQLRVLANLITAERGPLLLLGDLNLGTASPAWPEFLGAAGIGRGTGTAPATWPAGLGACGIGIDHLLGRELTLDGAQPFTIPGSDHRGLRAVVGVPIVPPLAAPAEGDRHGQR